MSPEKSQRQGWLRIVVENETPTEQINQIIQKVADYKLEGVIYVPDDFTQIGTIIEASMTATRFRNLRSREALSPEEKIEINEFEKLYHDFEFDEI